MDHSEAVRLDAAEKYILGELSPEIREAYEAHFFECEECANEVKATAAFAGALHEVLRNEAPQAAPERAGIQRWFFWLRPLVFAPALAVLLGIVCYQNCVTIPNLESAAAVSGAAQSADFVSLLGVNSRGDAAKTFQVHRDRPIILGIDIPASSEFSSYLLKLQDGSNRVIHQDSVSPSEAKNTVHVVLPKGSMSSGRYTLVILGEGAATTSAAPKEIEQLTFAVELLP